MSHDDNRGAHVVSEQSSVCDRMRVGITKEQPVTQRYGVIVKFLISADSPEEAEELIESVCEKAASAMPEGDISYEGIEDIEEADEDE